MMSCRVQQQEKMCAGSHFELFFRQPARRRPVVRALGWFQACRLQRIVRGRLMGLRGKKA